ncbi:MAG: PQQ-binding-like beta-propeller repeat protein [Verrucomicrobiota bacterium]
MLHLSRRALACAGLVFAAVLGRADWPQWRGPDRTGRLPATETLPARLPDVPPVAWKARAGEGFASAVIAAGRAFLFDGQDGRETLRAVSMEDGREAWRADIDEAFKDSQGPPGPRCTPVVDGDRVYVQSCRGELRCVSALDGKVLWGASYTRDFGAVFVGEKGATPGARRHGNNGSPLVHGDLLIASVGSTNGAAVVAFDKRTGGVRWKAGNEVAAYAPPVANLASPVPHVVDFMADAALGVELGTGRVLWRFPMRTDFARHVMTPVLAMDGALVLVGSHQTALMGLRLNPVGDGLGVSEAWRCREAAPNFSSGFATRTHYFGLGLGGALTCVEWATGRLAWSRPSWAGPVAERAHASFAWDGTRALSLVDDGQLVLWEPDAAGYREVSRVQACGNTWCQPAIAAGLVVVRDGLKATGQWICLRIR